MSLKCWYINTAQTVTDNDLSFHQMFLPCMVVYIMI